MARQTLKMSRDKGPHVTRRLSKGGLKKRLCPFGMGWLGLLISTYILQSTLYIASEPWMVHRPIVGLYLSTIIWEFSSLTYAWLTVSGKEDAILSMDLAMADLICISRNDRLMLDLGSLTMVQHTLAVQSIVRYLTIRMRSP